MAAVVGSVGAVLLAFAHDNVVTAVGACGAAGAGWWLGRQMRADFCSDPACAAKLSEDAREGPGCGGTIVGTIHDARERLDALERLDEHRPSSNAAAERPTEEDASADAGARDLPTRYRGKPMLIVIDSYALAVIGELPPDREADVRRVVQRTFGGDHNWRATVCKTMGWPATIDDEIRMNWSRFGQMAQEQGIPVDAMAFAESFGDEFSKY